MNRPSSIVLENQTDESWEKWGYALFLFGALLRIIFFFFATNNGGDALARAAVTASWLQHPTTALEFSGPHWLPIHFWLMALVSLAVGNVMLGTRLLSLIFGIFSLWAVWRITKDEFGVRPALLSLIIFTFYTLHLGYSTTSSSEATYIGLTLAGLLCFFAYRRTDDLRILALAGIVLTIDAGIRYEAWLFVGMIGVLLVVNSPKRAFLSKQHVTSVLVLACTATIWPVLWMIAQWRSHGDPLYGIHHNAESIASQIAVNPAHAGLYQFLLPPGVILLSLTPLAVAGSLYALYLAVRESKGRELAIIACGFILIQFKTLATGGMLAAARYTLTDGTLIGLLAGYGLYRLAALCPSLTYRTAAIATTAIMAINLVIVTKLSTGQNHFADKFKSISPLLQYPGRIQEVQQFLGSRLKSSDAIVIDDYNEEPNILAAAIGMPLIKGDRAFLASERDPSKVTRYLETVHPHYVIMAESGNLKPYLPLTQNCPGEAQLEGAHFTCIYQNQMYRVYSVSYPLAVAETAQVLSK